LDFSQSENLKKNIKLLLIWLNFSQSENLKKNIELLLIWLDFSQSENLKKNIELLLIWLDFSQSENLKRTSNYYWPGWVLPNRKANEVLHELKGLEGKDSTMYVLQCTYLGSAGKYISFPISP
jgi:hypothetical protein